MKFVLVNGRTSCPESFCASYLRKTYNRSLLLRSQVLRRSLQGCRASGQKRARTS
jgi:hypothetical protein